MNSRKGYKNRGSRRLLFVLACTFVGLIAFFYANIFLNNSQTSDLSDLTEKLLPPSDQDVELAEEARLVYPYSIIPGGVRSGDELAAHMVNDPVVSEHYKDFMVQNARLVRADETRMMHVSYRVGDEVYWTQNKVRIPEGELLVSDGDCEARARCGNRVSAAPMEPVAEDEPLTETFDIPQIARLTPPKLPPELPTYDMSMNPGIVLDPGLVPVLEPGPQQQAPREINSEMLLPEIPSEFISVPEPGILTLLLTGLAAIFAFGLLRKE